MHVNPKKLVDLMQQYVTTSMKAVMDSLNSILSLRNTLKNVSKYESGSNYALYYFLSLEILLCEK